MNKEELRARVEEVGIVPVIRTSSADDARFAVEEVARGGIPIIEVTMTVPGAIEVIRQLGKIRARRDPRRRHRRGYAHRQAMP